eukprot:353247-Karenia_brevis.AAC.1
MAGNGKLAHWSRQDLRIESFNVIQARFGPFCNASKSTGNAWPTAVNAHTVFVGSRGLKSFKRSIAISATASKRTGGLRPAVANARTMFVRS